MNEFIEKLISRLEEQKKIERNRPCDCDEEGHGDAEQIYDDGRSQGRSEQIHKTIEIVNQLAEEYKSNWILCSDRLPEEKEVMIGGDSVKSSEMVWIALENGSELQAHLENGRWYSFSGELIKDKVVAWHPAYRPPRYKAEIE